VTKQFIRTFAHTFALPCFLLRTPHVLQCHNFRFLFPLMAPPPLAHLRLARIRLLFETRGGGGPAETHPKIKDPKKYSSWVTELKMKPDRGFGSGLRRTPARGRDTGSGSEVKVGLLIGAKSFRCWVKCLGQQTPLPPRTLRHGADGKESRGKGVQFGCVGCMKLFAQFPFVSH